MFKFGNLSGQRFVESQHTDPHRRQTVLHVRSDKGELNFPVAAVSANDGSMTIEGAVTTSRWYPSQINWSVNFPGDAGFATPVSVAVTGTSDFTIEFFCNFSQTSLVNSVVRRILSRTANLVTGIQISVANQSILCGDTNTVTGGIVLSNNQNLIGTVVAVNDNEWHHIVFRRQGTTLTSFVDGILRQTVTAVTNFSSTDAIYIGQDSSAGTTGNFNGFLSNLRIVVGSTLPYVGNSITVPTSPLTRVIGTELLMLKRPFINREESINVFAISASNRPKLAARPFGPFVETESGISVYAAGGFGGANAIVAPSSSKYFIGTQPFTIEMWVQKPSTTGLSSLQTHMFFLGCGLEIWHSGRYGYFDAGFTVKLAGVGGPYDTLMITTRDDTDINQWNHIVLTRDSSNIMSLFINGVRQSSQQNGGVFGTKTSNIKLGAPDQPPLIIADCRVTIGQSLYNPNLTTCIVPTGSNTLTSGGADPTKVVFVGPTVAEDNNIAVQGTDVERPYALSASSNPLSFKPALGSINPFTNYNNWSLYFDGAQSTYAISNNIDWAPASQSFYAELWVQFDAIGTEQTIISKGTLATNGMNWVIRSDGRLSVTLLSSTYANTTMPPLRPNIWYHLVLMRNVISGNQNIYFYVNGTRYQPDTAPGAVQNVFTNAALRFGRSNNSTSFLSGYISNVRWNLPAGPYTPPESWPVPTVAYPNALPTGARFLVLRSERPTDIIATTSTSWFDDVAPRHPNLVPFGPFDAAGSYNPSVNGNSWYTASTSTAITLAPLDLDGRGVAGLPLEKFSIEFWLWVPSTYAADGGIFSTYPSGILSGAYMRIYLDATPAPERLSVRFNGITINGNLNQGEWNHVAVARDTSAIRLWLNGVYTAAITDSTPVLIPAGRPLIGGDENFGVVSDVHISGLRMCRGFVANNNYLVQANFTKPTTALSLITETGRQSSLFLNLGNNGFYDATNRNNIQATENVGPRGFLSPYGRQFSYYFDGTGDTVTTGAPFILSNNIVNIEFWVRFENFNNGSTDQVLFSFQGTTANTPYMYVSGTDGLLRFRGTTSANDIFTALDAGFVDGVWYHIAVIKDINNVFRVYRNGVYIATGSYSTTFGEYKSIVIGSGLKGYITDFRVTYGNVYTATTSTLGQIAITPPVTSMTATQTVTDQFSAIVTTNPNPAGTAGRNSVSFDGAGDFLSNAESTAFSFGTDDFTVEYWVYTINEPAGFNMHAGAKVTSSGFAFGVTSGKMYMTTLTAAYASTGTSVAIKTWNHFAFVRSSGTVNYYLNGVLDYTVSAPTNITETGFSIGATRTGANPMTGYISNLRVVKGSAVYTTDFTPSTSPLTAIQDTSLLACQSTTIIDNSVNNLTLAANGQAQVISLHPLPEYGVIFLSLNSNSIVDSSYKNTTTTKAGNVSPRYFIPYSNQLVNILNDYPTRSIYFNGVSGLGHIRVPHRPFHTFRTGNFTIEFWMYLPASSAGASRGLISKGASTTGWEISMNASNQIVFTSGSTDAMTTTQAIATDQWTFVTLVREGLGSGLTKLYLNGVLAASGLVATDFNQTEHMLIGSNRDVTTQFIGWLDDIRITKFIRYTGNHAVPTRPLPYR